MFILVLNFNHLPTGLHKRERIAVARGLPKCIIHPVVGDAWENNDASSGVNTTPIYKKPESRRAEMDQHGHVKDADEDSSKRD